MENKDINFSSESESLENTAVDSVNNDSSSAEEPFTPALDYVDREQIREAAENTEAEGITVAPIGEAPEIKPKKVSFFKKITDFFTSIRWKRIWDQIAFVLLILLFAVPIAFLVCVLTYFL